MIADPARTEETVRLMLGVARLGENDLRGWWQGHALDQTGRYVLSGTFRRTWRSAALELDIAAATQVHDELLGRPTAIHLFSDLLPFRRWASNWLAEQKTTKDADPLLSTLEDWTAAAAIEYLRTWSGHREAPLSEPLGDGLLLGRISASELADPSALQSTAHSLAAAYLDQAGTFRPPYLNLTR